MPWPLSGRRLIISLIGEDDFIFWVDAVQQCDLLPDNDLHPPEEREDLLDVIAQDARTLRATACSSCSPPRQSPWDGAVDVGLSYELEIDARAQWSLFI